MQRTPIALAVLAFCALSFSPAQADEAALKAEVDALRAEVVALKDAVNQMQSEHTAAVSNTAAAPVAPASAVQPARAVAAANSGPGMPNAGIALSEGTTLWGYGQINYNHPTARAADAQADLSRAVIGFNQGAYEALPASLQLFGKDA